VSVSGPHPFADQRGFTLAEVLLAAVIISVVFVALGTGVQIGSYGIQEGNQLSTATFLADQKLEQAKNLPWTSTSANDCLGISASSAAAPTVPAGQACTNGPTNISAGGAIPWLADETPVTGFSGYSRAVRVTDCGSGSGCAAITDPGMRLVTITVSYIPMTGTGVAATAKSVQAQTLVSER
jgi:prepilin-type N-terminal cleavage/methylation domain-containing protein